MTSARAAVAMALATMAASSATAAAHELGQTSATLVARDGGHVELRLQIPWAEVLRRQWMPSATPQEALTRMVAQSPEAFARALVRVERAIETTMRLVPDRGAAVPFSHWRWPAAAEVQSALRTELMSRLALGQAFEHASRLPAGAEVQAGGEVAAIRLAVAPLLGPTLVTAYRPFEQWLETGGTSRAFTVRPR